MTRRGCRGSSGNQRRDPQGARQSPVEDRQARLARKASVPEARGEGDNSSGWDSAAKEELMAVVREGLEFLDTQGETEENLQRFLDQHRDRNEQFRAALKSCLQLWMAPDPATVARLQSIVRARKGRAKR